MSDPADARRCASLERASAAVDVSLEHATDPDENAHPVATDPPAVLTVDELARLLRVERKTVYTLIAQGELPGVRRVGRSIRIFRRAVLDWLASGQGRVSRSRRTK